MNVAKNNKVSSFLSRISVSNSLNFIIDNKINDSKNSVKSSIDDIKRSFDN